MMKKWFVFYVLFTSPLYALSLHLEGEGRSWNTTLDEKASVDDLAKDISQTFGIPAPFLVLYHDDPPYFANGLDMRLHPSRRFEDKQGKTLKEIGLREGSRVYFKIRPVKGDHIHQVYAIVIGGQVILPLMDQRHFKAIHDSPFVEEERGEIEGTVYQKVYLHTGVHTHLDNLIHEHPWSAPFWFNFSEGLGANFGQFMQSVDLLYRQYPNEFSIEFETPPLPDKYPEKTKFANGDLIDGKPGIWRLAFWPDHNNPNQKQVYITDFDRVWLGHNMGMITLQFGPEDEKVIPPPEKFVDFMMSGTFPMLKGFDGEPYPSLSIVQEPKEGERDH